MRHYPLGLSFGLAIAGLWLLAGCQGVDPAATANALTCAMDLQGKIVPVVAAPDPAVAKALNAAVTAGAALQVDPACQAVVSAIKAQAH